MERAVTVSQLNQYIKTLLDADVRLQAVLVRGEISNFKQYPSVPQPCRTAALCAVQRHAGGGVGCGLGVRA